MNFSMLIVDDSSPMRKVIKKTIRASGFNVDQCTEARDGMEALEKLSQTPVDIVITDYNMPNMNGGDLVDKMKENPELATIPTLIITSERNDLKIAKFMEKGASYIQKPFTPEMIRSKLNELLGVPDDTESLEADDDSLDF